MKHYSRFALIFIALSITLLLSLMFGRYPIHITEVMDVVFKQLTGSGFAEKSVASDIIKTVRFPRALAAILVGASLSMSGAAYQGLFKNPMVSPDILGATAGAGFGASLAIMLSLDPVWIQLMAFVFSLLAVVLVYVISSRIKISDAILTMILTGLLVGTTFSALTSTLKYIADPYDKLPSITYWLMGSLASIGLDDLSKVIFPILIGAVILYAIRWPLNAMAFGEEEARSLGIQTRRIRFAVVIATTLMTASAVSIAGIIGWVGLIVPHFTRSIVGPNYEKLLPGSLLIGGIYLLIVDTLARTVFPVEIPLGILTSLIGAPFFIYMLLHSRRGWQ
ncbi:FecCD family ABC transporter permease [Fusibacter tunisiensis]|uniref:Iron complex transport system permease protein n=1 Tax=Fusibacter tunisiensis TaxID=1008308 RepID=A0ABS2MSP7_9FIRM|nr:iron ABC transporter permease [Fusibacter tunisiensis]MBM7562448.1 iron complex transport system permease protein [Fusibacter tunisiensis]